MSVLIDGKERASWAAAVFVGFDANLGPDRAEHVAQPRARAVEPRFDRQQRTRIALEEGDVGTVAADRDLDGERATPGRGGQRPPDERRLAVAPWGNEEDLLAGEQIGGEPIELGLAIDERGRWHDLAVDERIGHVAPAPRGAGVRPRAVSIKPMKRMPRKGKPSCGGALESRLNNFTHDAVKRFFVEN